MHHIGRIATFLADGTLRLSASLDVTHRTSAGAKFASQMSTVPPGHTTEKDSRDGETDGRDTEGQAAPGGLNPRVLMALLALVVIAGGVALLTIGGSSNANSKREAARKAHLDAAALLTPAQPAPPLALRNYLGQPVNIDSYRGKAVLVTFLYTNCPDVCPLITSNLRVAQNLMKPSVRSKVQIIAVSVDPKGDTSKAVASFLERHGMTGRMQYLVGSAHELARVWKAWGVGSARDAEQPQFVNHSGLIYGISASGKRLDLYASSFQPSEIAHDVPLLASE
jgi:protein SCO1/2